ncbi:hypothetical protein K2173_019672 [Erythroxylum novogranatense]|uniref:DUF7811 domain-containing protein n=1 Tax=Erythroxylum novogranatense TaxID=1862640 RepID=A0AAV8UF75_9ROSI|nr:hypothetical protein K2173_019672 [Erythroxylum novogranatense]
MVPFLFLSPCSIPLRSSNFQLRPMSETSALCFSTVSSGPSVHRFREATPFVSISRLPVSSPSISRRRSPRFFRITFKASNSGNFSSEDFLGSFPWSDGDNAIEWIQEDRVTLFTADGLIHIGGSVVPRLTSSDDRKQGRANSTQRYQRFQESDYMDPNQGLCLGALFDIAATNVRNSCCLFFNFVSNIFYYYNILSLQGLDTGRRLCIFGFCRSIEMLSDVVEDTVLEHGGEIVAAEKAMKGGLHEKLTMTVAVPYLWGVPPASETLRLAVRSGGGIVEKVYWQWDFL